MRFFIIVISILIALFFPIFFEADIHYDMNRKKFAFNLLFYKWLKILGGYVSPYPGGIALHISPKKAILIPYSKMNSERKRFSFLKTFRLVAFRITTETGVEYLFTVAAVHTAIRAYFLATGKDVEKIEENLWLTDGDILRVSFNTVLYFNLYILLRNFVIFLKEKMKILCRRKINKSTV